MKTELFAQQTVDHLRELLDNERPVAEVRSTAQKALELTNAYPHEIPDNLVDQFHKE